MKKQIYLIIIGISFIWGLSGCGDFLEESSLDEIRPSTATDLEQLMLGEAYLGMSAIFNYIELLTDNVESSYSTASGQESCLLAGAPIFTWQADMYEQMELNRTSGGNTWEMLYERIKGCNVVLDMLDRVTGSEEGKSNVKGQALGLRAFYYFILVNTYGQPYNAEGVDINTTPGVPLIIESTVKDEFPARASVGTVYKQIETDLLEAKSLLDKYGQNNYQYKVSPLFVDLLLSRMYLYMEKWDKVVEYASDVITKKPTLLRLSDYVTIEEDWFGEITISYDRQNGGVYNYDSPEVIWGYSAPGDYSTYFVGVNPFLDPGSKPAFTVSEDLIKAHEEEDLRIGFYYVPYIASFFPLLTPPLTGEKCKDDKRSNSSRGMRVAEAYLNRAEANIRLFMHNGNDDLRQAALSDLNYLREFRFMNPYTDVDIQKGDDLLTFCLKERRCELSFEDHRWFDLRRLGMPEIKHKFTIVSDQTQEYILPQNSVRYVLPIAREVIDKNPALVQNP